MKTQDNKSILIEIADEGWKFNCNNYDIDIDNGLYFGKKNTHIDNQNIFITGIISEKNTNIKNGQRVVIIDDLVATGGTAIACAELLTENFKIKKSNIFTFIKIRLTK